MATMSDHERACELREQGESARRANDLRAAKKSYEEAVALLRNSPDKLKFAHAVRHLGDVYVQLQDWSRAEPCFVEALNIYRSQPEARVLDFANAIRGFAVLKDKTGKPEESSGLWAEAGRMYQAEGVQAGIEECSRHTGQPK